MKPEVRTQMRIRMELDEQAAFRAEHALEGGDSTRARPIDVVTVELAGLGEDRGRWDATAVRVT